MTNARATMCDESRWRLTTRAPARGNAGDGIVDEGVCPECHATWLCSLLVSVGVRCSSSPRQRAGQIFVFRLDPHRGKAHSGTTPIMDTFLSVLRRIRSGVFALRWYAVTARRRAAPRPVMRQRALFAAARRGAISTPNRWEATSVAVNDKRGQALPSNGPSLLRLQSKAPRRCCGDERP